MKVNIVDLLLNIHQDHRNKKKFETTRESADYHEVNFKDCTSVRKESRGKHTGS